MSYEFVVWLLLVVAGVLLVGSVLRRRKRQIVYEGSVGLLYRDGRFQREVGPGRYTRLDLFGRTDLFIVPLQPRVVPRPSLTVISRDQFSFRIGLTLTVRVTDARAYRESAGFTKPPAIRGLEQFALEPSLHTAPLDAAFTAALLELCSRRTLEEFIAAPSEGLAELAAAVTAPGLVLEQVAITEIIVPPEVRKMFTEVERARREGLAQLERARSEQASLRTLANAARTLHDNPQLAELRMLQLMEGAKGNKTFVLGKALLDGSPSGPSVER